MVASMPVRAEFPSLATYLANNLTPDELSSVGLLSFNQWDFTLGALIEAALTAHDLGSRVTVGFWADRTPVHDPGWTTSRWAARLTLTRGKDENAARALIAAGLPSASIAAPPIKRWHPHGLPALPEPLTRTAIRGLDYHSSGMGRSILQVHPDANTPIRDDYVWPRRWIEKSMTSYAWVFDQTTALINERGITALVVYNGRFTHDRAAAAAATAAGVRVLYYDAGGLETAFDLTFATTHDWADLQQRMIRMWDGWDEPERAEIGASWFTNRREHKEPGLEVFVGSQTRGHLGDLPDAEQLVVFFSSSGDEIVELELDWADYLHSQEQALADLATACAARPGTQLVVRTHPHMRLKPADDLAEWMAAVEAAAPAQHFDPYSPVDSYELMRAADIVFTYGSTSGVESAFVGKPVVVMGPSAYDLLGCAQRITSMSEIPALLETHPITEPQRSLLYGLMMQRRGFNFAYITRRSDGVMQAGGVALTDAREIARKISHAVRLRTTRRLTA